MSNIKPEKGKLYVNPRNSARVTTDSYSHLQLKEQLVLAGVYNDWFLDEFTKKVGLNGELKRVDLGEGEAPHVLRAYSFLEETILKEIANMKRQALNGGAPYRVMSHNLDVPIK